MTRAVVLSIWAVVGAVAVVCEVVSLGSPRRVAGFADVLDRFSARRWRLVVAFLGWAWLGWHFFAR